MDNTDLKHLLKSIGMGIFVRYFHEFCNSRISNQEMIALLQSKEEFTRNASAGRTANARRIFREGLEKQALAIIAKSNRVKREVTVGAVTLLIKLALQKAAEERKKMAMFHSQVLLHAELLEDLDPAEFCRDVGVPASYHIEFRKMIAAAHTLSELGYSIQKI